LARLDQNDLKIDYSRQSTPNAELMSQQALESGSQRPPSARQDDAEPAGHPKTPYAIAAALVGTISTYSVLFKQWDSSSFFETLANPDYWLFLALIFLGAGIAASLVRKQGRAIDTLIVVVLFIASVTSIAALAVVDRQALPSEKTFTIVLFRFTNHMSTPNLEASFRDNLRRNLEIKYHNDVLVLERDRELKGEKLEEKTNNARKWGTRRSGCHLAVWGELSTDPTGHDYVSLHSVAVSPFGAQLNLDDLTIYDNLNWNIPSTQADGDNAIGQKTVDFATSRIAFSYGLANYAKADYAVALRILSTVRIPESEFFAGRAAYQTANDSRRAREMFKESVNHFLEAIALDKEGTILVDSYVNLGYTYNSMLAYGVSENPKADAGKAIDVYSKAAEIYEKAGNQQKAAGLITKKGLTLFNLYIVMKDEDRIGANQALNEAKNATLGALSRMSTKSEDYDQAENLLGLIYAAKGDYGKAIEAHEIALGLVQSQDFRREVLTDLAEAQTSSAWKKKDKQLYEQGMTNFERAAQGCPPTSQDINCHNAHLNAGVAALNWARRLVNGSPDWTREMERALSEFDLAVNFVSKTEQATYYADAKRLTSMADTELGWVTRGDDRTSYFEAALAALTDGITALSDAHRDSAALREKRAESYGRLADDLPDGAAKNEYVRLAREDREFVKASAPKAAAK
jgi:tetratricopeptide (TPR) repeat protein